MSHLPLPQKEAESFVDIGLEQKLFENITVHVYANNILREDHQEVYGFPMPKDVYGVNVKMTFF